MREDVRLLGALRRRWRVWLALVVAILLAPPLLVLYVSLATGSRRYAEPSEVPAAPVAIVFGAGLRRDGRPSMILADRVRGAVELYQLGRVGKLLMTGDNSSVEYDEVTAMRRYAIEQGIPERDITLDYAGFDTYDSCFRARVIFGVRNAVIVTQQFHLPRAVYTCQQLGIDAHGLGTPDWGRFRVSLMRWLTLREAVATLNALLEVHITHPQPTFLGPFEGIS